MRDAADIVASQMTEADHKGDTSIVMHRPHPQPEAPRGYVRRIAEFIEIIRGD